MGLIFSSPDRTGQTEVRAFAPGDLDAVADLFQRVFRDPSKPATDALRAYLRSVFLDHPWIEDDLRSKVYQAPGDERVSGFIGVLPMRMRYHDEPIRAVHAGSLMVADAKSDPLAGARLLRSVLNGPQDLTLSESANPLTQDMWTRLGGDIIPGYSLDWIRVLRAADLAASEMSQRFALAKLLKPFTGPGNRLAGSVAPEYLSEPGKGSPRFSSSAVDDETIAEILPGFFRAADLYPDFTPADLVWRLGHAAEKTRHGNLSRRVVAGPGGKPAGAYLYYCRPGGIAWVLNIFATDKTAGAVVGDLVRQAFEEGAIAVRGRAVPALTTALMRHGALFLHRSATTAASRRPDLMQAIALGKAEITGIAAEAWTRLIGHAFT